MRDSYLDTARGAGIILVVYGHVLRGLFSAGLVPAGWPSALLAATDYTIYTFHMPLFFLLSGLHVPKSLRRAGDVFLLTKLRTIVYPYFVWSLLQGAVQIALSARGTNHAFTPNDLLAIGWRPFGQFWFLYALFICMLIAWAVSAITLRARTHGGASGANGENGGTEVSGENGEPSGAPCAVPAMPIVLVLLAIGGLAAVAFVAGSATRRGIVSMTLAYFPFFVLGMLIGERLPAFLERVSSGPALVAVAATFAASVAFAHRFGESDSIWALPAALSGSALVLLVAHRAARRGDAARHAPRASWLEYLGFASMPIYLAHILATAATRIALVTLGIVDVGAQLALGTFAGVLGPTLLYALALRAGTARLAGFPPLPAGYAMTPDKGRIGRADAA
ncbi:acyltransferase [Burkholderia pseudomallei]|uniref:acyltransferase family protein n=1 Tax=Burkholderia pseudomallei TaxID=28450 RepID=UPI0003D8AC09|nr:acyltransferase [Burkholderia pseudomallei]AHE32258.1 acyltransferase family protein [Burkholderia pseudomallei NAU20B-16]AHG35027.1 acyltransferase family protein [Burkholderia pseudomallei MSHR511]AHG68757.1 acyltransferase family protein [Burkholderia pseudomallei MSHR146]KGW26867.1 acyltransferase family protein [Burkholderia pseudomallei MSHR3016]KGW88843.1 acyltransferase family protein [Burkholderia pseudomallei MSHR332]